MVCFCEEAHHLSCTGRHKSRNTATIPRFIHGKILAMIDSSMWRSAWEDHYADALPHGKDRLLEDSGTAIMFHSVLDGRLAVQAGTFERLLADEPEIERDVLDHWGEVPDEINSPADLVLGFVASFGQGLAMQRMIRDEHTFQWALNRLGYDELALGGTSANMAMAVVSLDVPRVLVYANPLTRPLAEAFPESPSLMTIGSDGRTGTPREVAEGDDVFAIHWILEYQAGDTLTIGPHALTAPRANRFIPSWNPANNQLRLSEGFMQTFAEIATDYRYLFVSGFHILSDRYPDGSTALDCIRPVADYLGMLRERAPNLRFHCELASIAGELVRKGVREMILPRMDSLGLNEAELMNWLEDLGHANISEQIRTTNSPVAVLDGVCAIAEATGVGRVHLHHLGYYLVVCNHITPKSVRQGLLTGACAAAIRAREGRATRHDEIGPMAEIPLQDHSFELMTALTEYIEGDDFITTGIGTCAGHTVVMIPTRIVDRPVRTVGLGDTISASSWLAEPAE